MENNDLITLAGHQLRSAQRILVVTHIRPDGDAIGSLIALGLALQVSEKDVSLVSKDGVPTRFNFLDGSRLIQKSVRGKFDYVVVLDCSDLSRTGDVLFSYPVPDLNIDHHITNQEFAKINLVDTCAVATTEMLFDLLIKNNFPVKRSVAAAILTGIITDTIGFRTSNMTPKAIKIVAKLMELGAELPELYRQSMINRSFESALYWGSGLKKLEREDRMVWTTLTLNDRKAVNYPGRDDADLINVLSSIDDIDISLIFVEQPNGHVKVSWRAQPGYDVSKVAQYYGGGGHSSASGADINGDLADVTYSVLEKTRSLFNKQEN